MTHNASNFTTATIEQCAEELERHPQLIAILRRKWADDPGHAAEVEAQPPAARQAEAPPYLRRPAAIVDTHAAHEEEHRLQFFRAGWAVVGQLIGLGYIRVDMSQAEGDWSADLYIAATTVGNMLADLLE